MVRVEMLTVGKELLIGRTLNTNAHWAGGRLARMGSMLKEVTTVDDDLVEISKSLKEILGRKPDFLVVVGGLGPTPDDMTLEGVARGLRVKTKLNGEAVSLIRAHYARRGMERVELTPARRKMAVLPVGADPVLNEAGTAPGVRIASGATVIFCLPGVPAEMRSIFRKAVEPEVKKKLGRLHRRYLKLKVEGIFESALAPMIAAELRKHPAAYIKSHPRGLKEGVSRIELDIALVGEDAAAVDKEALQAAEEIVTAMKEAGATVKSIKGAGGSRSLN
jgi:nicotinamide-nucleotide amidase